MKNEKAPITLFGQLLWREFFYVAATRNPNFDRMKGNDICIKIPWDDNPKALAKWAEGMTGMQQTSLNLNPLLRKSIKKATLLDDNLSY